VVVVVVLLVDVVVEVDVLVDVLVLVLVVVLVELVVVVLLELVVVVVGQGHSVVVVVVVELLVVVVVGQQTFKLSVILQIRSSIFVRAIVRSSDVWIFVHSKSIPRYVTKSDLVICVEQESVFIQLTILIILDLKY
jgi:hypothetical protein